MYDIIAEIIGHTWASNYTGDQNQIYYICGALICLLTVALVDIIKSVFAAFVRK